MEAVPEQEYEVGRGALRRLELIQLARGKRDSFWPKVAKERLATLTLLLGVFLLLDNPEFTGSYTGVFGVLLIVLGMIAPRDRSSERLDALVEYLDSTGQLDPNPNRSVDG